MRIREIKVPLTVGKLVDRGKRFLGMRVITEGELGRFELFDVDQRKTVAVISKWENYSGYTEALGNWYSCSPRVISDKGCYAIFHEAEDGNTSIIDCYNKDTFRNEARLTLSQEYGQGQCDSIVDAERVAGNKYLVACARGNKGGVEIFCSTRGGREMRSLGVIRSNWNRPFAGAWFENREAIIHWGFQASERETNNFLNSKQKCQISGDLSGIFTNDEDGLVIQHQEVNGKKEAGYRFSSGLETVNRNLFSWFSKKTCRIIRDGNSGNELLAYEANDKMDIYQWAADGGQTLFHVTVCYGKEPHCVVRVIAYDRGIPQTLERKYTVNNRSMFFRMDEETGALYCWNEIGTTVFSVER